MKKKLVHNFNYKKYNNLKVSLEILDIFSRLKENISLTKIKGKDFPLTLSILESTSKRTSLRSSNLLDGVVNSYETFSNICFDENYEFKYDNELEILGYKNAYEYVLNNFRNIDLTLEFIKDLHFKIFEKTPNKKPGEFRHNNKVRVVENKNMFSKTLYSTKFCEHSLIDDYMENLLANFNDPAIKIEPLILIPIFINDFLNISPFSDGNGRVSRLLILYFLLKNKYEIVRYISFDKSIELNQDIYFSGLKKCSVKRNRGLNSVLPFIYSFLYCLNDSYNVLLNEFNIKESKKITSKNKVYELVKRNYYPISKSEIHFMLPTINISTIESSLYDLVKENKIVKYGTTKDATYLKNKN